MDTTTPYLHNSIFLVSTATTMPRPKPFLITIPGTIRSSSRRSATNPTAGITAFVVPEKETGILCTVKIALRKDGRVLGLTLKEHEAPIIDLEFLQTPHGTPIHVLGSCDRDGVVKLWFLYLAVDSLGIVIGPKLLRMYSFYTLRRSTSAFYSRIRLAGTVEYGTMVLVPNDGANVRVVTFLCEARQPTDGDMPLVDARETLRTFPLGDPYLAERRAVGLDDLVTKSITDASLTFELAGHRISAEDSLREHGVSSRSTMNSSAAQARLDTASAAAVDDMTKDIVEAAAMATGTSVHEMEVALDPLQQSPQSYHSPAPPSTAPSPPYGLPPSSVDEMLRPMDFQQSIGVDHQEPLVVEGEGLSLGRF